MKSGQISEIRLLNFRCFKDRQTARVRPLTLLVGDNSTGKTSFLAAVRAIWDVVHQQTEPDFRASPYDLGSFTEIVHHEEGDKNSAVSFAIGFSGLYRRRRRVDADIRFESRAAAPFPAKTTLKTSKAWITYVRDKQKDDAIVEFGAGDDSWRFQLDREFVAVIQFGIFFHISVFIKQHEDMKIRLEKISGERDRPDSDTIEKIANMLDEFSFPVIRSGLFAGAPIRSSPHRTYDPTKPLPDPEGGYIPTYFANVSFQDKAEWNALKETLEEFGRMSGLFQEIGVKQLGDMEGGPFQLEIKVGGGGEARGGRNLIDVGYGVSQVLPVLTEVLRPDAPPMMLFQQPEVHLHPSAQAAQGSLFCSAAATGRQLIVETHSDYIIDRVLLDIRDKRTKLKPDDVSILYFERGDRDVTIHSIRIDAEGNILDAPDGYRKFFKDELNRVINY